jgi:hypothetical protein
MNEWILALVMAIALPVCIVLAYVIDRKENKDQ